MSLLFSQHLLLFDFLETRRDIEYRRQIGDRRPISGRRLDLLSLRVRTVDRFLRDVTQRVITAVIVIRRRHNLIVHIVHDVIVVIAAV